MASLGKEERCAWSDYGVASSWLELLELPKKRALSELVFLLTKFLTSHSSTSPPTTRKEQCITVLEPVQV